MNIHGNISNNRVGGVTVNKDFFDDFLDDDEDFDEEDERRQKPKTFTKGFITALSVCLVAIGAAVWTTVSSVNSYLNPTVSVYETAVSDSDKSESAPAVSANEAQVNATVSGVKADSDTDTDKHVRFNCEPIKNHKMIADYSETPVYNETLGDYRAHTGIDYEAEIDDKVRAMGKGVVKDIYYDDLLGNVVVIEHSKDVSSYYCGLAKTALVQAGEVVNAGDFVGTVYAIPGEAAQQAHVHVAVKEGGRWVDPKKFMIGKSGQAPAGDTR